MAAKKLKQAFYEMQQRRAQHDRRFKEIEISRLPPIRMSLLRSAPKEKPSTLDGSKQRWF